MMRSALGDVLNHIARCRWRCVVRLRRIAGDVFSHRAMSLAMCCAPPAHRRRRVLTSRDVAGDVLCASGVSPVMLFHIARCRWRCVVCLRLIAGDVIPHRAMSLAMCCAPPVHRRRRVLTSRDVAGDVLCASGASPAMCSHIARCCWRCHSPRPDIVWRGAASSHRAMSRDVKFASRDAKPRAHWLGMAWPGQAGYIA